MQERRLLGVVAQQLVAEAVDEEDDVPPTLGELDRGGAEAGVDTHRGRDRGQDVAERAVAVGRGGELVGHRAGVVPAVLADSTSAKESTWATASTPSAAALTRIEKSSEAITPV